MSGNVTPFPITRRIASESDGVGGTIYFKVAGIARRIHYLLEVLARQDTQEDNGRTFKYVRKRTIKRCFLALSKRGERLENTISSLRVSDIAFDTAISIFLELLKVKHRLSEDNIEKFREELNAIELKTKEIDIIILLLSRFQLTPSQIINTFSGHTSYLIRGYEDDVYAFLRSIQNTTQNK